MTYCVYLVPGTWSRGFIKSVKNPIWYDENSSFCNDVKEQLGGDVQFKKVSWGERNTVTARHDAARNLSTMLEEGIRDFPQARHVVIAHSHGGNAILYALRMKAPKNSLHGIIMLATPFIEVERIPFTRFERNLYFIDVAH